MQKNAFPLYHLFTGKRKHMHHFPLLIFSKTLAPKNLKWILYTCYISQSIIHFSFKSYTLTYFCNWAIIHLGVTGWTSPWQALPLCVKDRLILHNCLEDGQQNAQELWQSLSEFPLWIFLTSVPFPISPSPNPTFCRESCIFPMSYSLSKNVLENYINCHYFKIYSMLR